MIIAGIDYSLSCPSITVGPNKDFRKLKTFYYTKDKKKEGKFSDNIFGMMIGQYSSEEERYDLISEWAMTVLIKFKVTHVCLEGYSMGSKGRVFNIAENAGLLKHKMWKAGIQFESPAPTSVKKYFTGKGNSNKIQMHEAFEDKTKIDISAIFNAKKDSNPVSDIVDSYAMFCYGYDELF